MRGLTLPEDVLCYIAAKVENNTRELEGAITKIQGMSMLQNGLIDLDLAKAALGDSATAEQKRITIQQILDAVTKYYNVRLSDLQSKKRHKSIAFPRQVCMFLARRHTRYSPGRNRRLLRRPRSHHRAARRPHRRSRRQDRSRDRRPALANRRTTRELRRRQWPIILLSRFYERFRAARASGTFSRRACPAANQTLWRDGCSTHQGSLPTFRRARRATRRSDFNKPI